MKNHLTFDFHKTLSVSGVVDSPLPTKGKHKTIAIVNQLRTQWMREQSKSTSELVPSQDSSEKVKGQLTQVHKSTQDRLCNLEIRMSATGYVVTPKDREDRQRLECRLRVITTFAQFLDAHALSKDASGQTTRGLTAVSLYGWDPVCQTNAKAETGVSALDMAHIKIWNPNTNQFEDMFITLCGTDKNATLIEQMINTMDKTGEGATYAKLDHQIELRPTLGGEVNKLRSPNASARHVSIDNERYLCQGNELKIFFPECYTESPKSKSESPLPSVTTEVKIKPETTSSKRPSQPENEKPTLYHKAPPFEDDDHKATDAPAQTASSEAPSLSVAADATPDKQVMEKQDPCLHSTEPRDQSHTTAPTPPPLSEAKGLYPTAYFQNEAEEVEKIRETCHALTANFSTGNLKTLNEETNKLLITYQNLEKKLDAKLPESTHQASSTAEEDLKALVSGENGSRSLPYAAILAAVSASASCFPHQQDLEGLTTGEIHTEIREFVKTQIKNLTYYCSVLNKALDVRTDNDLKKIILQNDRSRVQKRRNRVPIYTPSTDTPRDTSRDTRKAVDARAEESSQIAVLQKNIAQLITDLENVRSKSPLENLKLAILKDLKPILRTTIGSEQNTRRTLVALYGACKKALAITPALQYQAKQAGIQV